MSSNLPTVNQSQPSTDDSAMEPEVATEGAMKVMRHEPIPVGAGQLPSNPRISAGVRMPGMATIRIKRWLNALSDVTKLEPSMRELNDQQLRKTSLALRYRAMSGVPLVKLLPEAFALVREAGRRSMGMRHFDVQIVGGAALFDGCIAEMQTGEGKTLTATLPLYLHSLVGKGAHLATVNDYLAERDAKWMEPLYKMLGVTVGIVLTDSSQDHRRKAYASDVTYGTAKEFGFDFLRDRLLLRSQGRILADFLGEGSSERWTGHGDEPVQRTMHFALVDEAGQYSYRRSSNTTHHRFSGRRGSRDRHRHLPLGC